MSLASTSLSHSDDRRSQRHWYATGFAAVALIVAARLLLHLLTANRYGIFRDELYYIACSRHLDWGYVDMPPFIPAVTWLFTSLFGSSLFVIRLIPAIAGCGAIALTGYQAYQFGGRRFAMALSALAMAVSAVFVINGHLLGTNDFEAAFLDGLRLGRHSHHPDRQSEAVAVVRRAGGRRSAEQVFDGRVRTGHRYRIAVHAGTQGLRPQVDLDRWRTGVSDFPAEPALECPSRLAIRAVDAQHPRQRPRRCAESCAIRPAADA